MCHDGYTLHDNGHDCKEGTTIFQQHFVYLFVYAYKVYKNSNEKSHVGNVISDKDSDDHYVLTASQSISAIIFPITKTISNRRTSFKFSGTEAKTEVVFKTK